MNVDVSACERVRARLPELLDGGLDALSAARDAGHLEACAGCAAERAGLERLQRSVRRALSPAPAEVERALAGLEARLAAAQAPHASKVLPRRVAWRAAAALATAAAAILVLSALARTGIAPGVSSERIHAALQPSVRPVLPDFQRVIEDGLLFRGPR